MEFKIGDRVVKVRRYANDEYGGGGSENYDIPLGTQGVVMFFTRGLIHVRYDNGINWSVDKMEIDLVNMSKPEDLVRYMVYGLGCDNKSNLYLTEKELKDSLRKKVKDSSWAGRIIAYKLTPIYEATLVTKLKVFKKVKITKKQ